ncbi:hypothetical protein [Aquimarina muelleri]|uniref:Uncharacterized protein n=1 Tax=Aquimarina muelleri TaxID=279356 RepID=A0A918JWQ9_9FLAO|nr:hypothetical protein [Aquimarina muelleri]MCX2762414.1 hypothetical protein [Aquimarina muelleri]GGX24711.1 hypothetical protein GCM10007384_27200 [Aquimarina muelleri]
MSKSYNLVAADKLLEEVRESELYSQVVMQIQKDLNRAGMDHTIKSEKPQGLFLEIVNLLLEKLHNDFNEFLNLLYAVDVSESEIKKLDSEDSTDIAKYATYLILKREWQKVWYRNQ